MVHKSLAAALAIGGALALSAPAAHAQTNIISFSFSGNSSNPQYVDPTLNAGVVSAPNYNTDNGGNTGSVSDGSQVAYSDGASSGLTLTYNSYDAQSGPLQKNSSYNSDGNQQLMNGFIESGPPAAVNASATVSVSSVPFASYSVYVYFFNAALATAPGASTTSVGTYSIATNSGATTSSQNAKLQSTFDPANPFSMATATTAGDYLLFTGLTGPTFTLTANRVTGDTSSGTFIPIDGFQVVGTPAAAPEPAGFVPFLLGMGLLGGMIAARRRVVKDCA